MSSGGASTSSRANRTCRAAHSAGASSRRSGRRPASNSCTTSTPHPTRAANSAWVNCRRRRSARTEPAITDRNISDTPHTLGARRARPHSAGLVAGTTWVGSSGRGRPVPALQLGGRTMPWNPRTDGPLFRHRPSPIPAPAPAGGSDRPEPGSRPPIPSAGRALDRPPADRPTGSRHVWIQDPPNFPGCWPGLLLAWRRGRDGWVGHVVVAPDTDDGQAVVLTCWLPADRLRPA